MAWCEANGVDFLFGLAKNERLIAEIKTALDLAATKSRQAGAPLQELGVDDAQDLEPLPWPRPSGRKGKPILDSSSPRCRPPTCILSAKCFSI
jgi:hypothetical protein